MPATASTDQRQFGVALVFVIFIVFLVAALSVSLLSAQFVQVRRLENSKAFAQSLQYAYGVEAWGMEMLKLDQRTSQIDHLKEEWAKPLPTTAVDRDGAVTVAGTISDLSARFNLNQLTRLGIANTQVINSFKQFTNRLGIKNANIDAIVDWIDRDKLARPGGAESPYYLRQEPAYNVPDRTLSSHEEIAYIRGIQPEFMDKTRQILTSLPEPAPYNLNTIPAILFPVAIPGLTESAAKSLIQLRQQTPWKTTQEFIQALKTGNRMAPKVISKINILNIAVQSHYFLITATVKFEDSEIEMLSSVYRDPAGGIQVYQRTLHFIQ